MADSVADRSLAAIAESIEKWNETGLRVIDAPQALEEIREVLIDAGYSFGEDEDEDSEDETDEAA